MSRNTKILKTRSLIYVIDRDIDMSEFAIGAWETVRPKQCQDLDTTETQWYLCVGTLLVVRGGTVL